MTRSPKSQQPYQYHHLNMRQTMNTKWIFSLTVEHRSAWLGLPTSTNYTLTPISLYHPRRLLLLLVDINLNAIDEYQSSLPLVPIPPINPFTYIIKWIEFTSADRAALKQKSYHHLSHIPCLKPLHQRLQPYQLPRHHPPDHLNSHILIHSKTYWNWKIIF